MPGDWNALFGFGTNILLNLLVLTGLLRYVLKMPDDIVFGFMHGEAIGFAQSPVVALAYLGVAGVMFACAKYAAATPKAIEPNAPHGAVGQLAG